MNKEEAIQILSTIDAHGVLRGYTSVVTEALDTAIEALRQEPMAEGKWKTVIRHEHYPSGREYEADYCSVCGKRGSLEYLYCPFCGARMENKEYMSVQTFTNHF